MGKYDVKIVSYADDAAVVADNEDDLQRLLLEFGRACEKFDLNKYLRQRN